MPYGWSCRLSHRSRQMRGRVVGRTGGERPADGATVKCVQVASDVDSGRGRAAGGGGGLWNQGSRSGHCVPGTGHLDGHQPVQPIGRQWSGGYSGPESGWHRSRQHGRALRWHPAHRQLRPAQTGRLPSGAPGQGGRLGERVGYPPSRHPSLRGHAHPGDSALGHLGDQSRVRGRARHLVRRGATGRDGGAGGPSRKPGDPLRLRQPADRTQPVHEGPLRRTDLGHLQLRVDHRDPAGDGGHQLLHPG